MVDCGEATCRQAVVGGIVPALIKNIFITHLHGDHCFGLVGMLSLVSADRVEHSVPEVTSLKTFQHQSLFLRGF